MILQRPVAMPIFAPDATAATSMGELLPFLTRRGLPSPLALLHFVRRLLMQRVLSTSVSFHFFSISAISGRADKPLS